MKKIFILMAVLCNAVGGLATIINIPADYPTIQEGVDAAQNGDTVLVAPGEYIENPLIENTNTLLTSSDGPDVTMIRGNVELLGDLDTTCVLRGFTLTKNVNRPNYSRYPLIDIHQGSPIIMGNVIRDNIRSPFPGSGIFCRSGAIIRNNIIRNNHAFGGGGGIMVIIGTPLIEGNIISNNSASTGSMDALGGGVFMISGAYVVRNLIVGNEASCYLGYARGGGLLHFGDPTCHIFNNTIVDNRTWSLDHSSGGGIEFAVGSEGEDVILRNNIVVFGTSGGGVSVSSISDTTWTGWDYNLVFGNEPYDYEGIEPGPHDVQEDPLFIDRFSGDYSLLPNSPCIDAGDPDFPLDPDGTRADIGAYYFDQTVGINDPSEPSGPYQFQLHQNYPNPFNAQTIISYYLSEEAVVSLHIYSITGHFVIALSNKESQMSGEHKYVWDGNDKNGKMVSTGIYFYELYVDDYRESKAMIMIK